MRDASKPTGVRDARKPITFQCARRKGLQTGQVQHRIGLKPRLRRQLVPVGWFARKSREVETTGYSWTVDGMDLADWIRQRKQTFEPVAPAEETIWLAGSTEDARERLDRLEGRLPPEFSGERVALLTCEECGDLGCGALSAELEITADTVKWERLGWESATAEEPPFLYDPPLSLAFDTEQYTETLASARRRLIVDSQ